LNIEKAIRGEIYPYWDNEFLDLDMIANFSKK
jgi:hypothetical protein